MSRLERLTRACCPESVIDIDEHVQAILATLAELRGMTEWVVVPGWEKFQHYHDRRPTWIKDYPEQIDRDEYRALSPTARALLQDVRRLCALSDGVVRKDAVSARLGMRLKRAHWKELTDAGFLAVVASKPLALARAREETERETPKSPFKKKPKTRNSKVTGWRLVRGSHGMTHVPDPEGTDRPPFDAVLKEMH